MKKNKLLVALLCTLPLGFYSSQAQNKLVIEKVTEKQHYILQSTKPTGFGAVQVPRFVLSDQNGKFIMALGGYLKPIVGMDIGNSLGGSIYFNPSNIKNIPAVTGQKGNLFMNPLHSTLDMQVVALPESKNQITAYISYNFSGGTGGYEAKLQAAYLKYRNFLVGYNYSVFTDVRSLPTTISESGITGNDWSKGYQISYNSPIWGGFSFGAGLEIADFNNSNSDYEGPDYPKFNDHPVIGNADQSIPDIPFYVQYGWSQHSHIRFSGLVRNFKYVDLLNDKSNIVTGMGFQFSTALKLAKPLTFLGQITYGKGIGHYIDGMQYLKFSYLPDSEPGKVKATKMLGWFAGLRCFITEKMFINGTFGQTRAYDISTYWKDYRYGLDARISAFYNITPYLQTGIEYLWGRQVTVNRGGANDSRIQAMIMFSL